MSDTPASKDVLRKVGLAAVILLAPGGFILGATLLAARLARKDPPPPSPE